MRTTTNGREPRQPKIFFLNAGRWPPTTTDRRNLRILPMRCYRSGSISGKMFALDEKSIELIGRDLVTQLKGATAFLYERIPATQREISARLEEMQEFVKEEFPKERVPSFQLVLPLNKDQSAGH